jgi:outer membrane protein
MALAAQSAVGYEAGDILVRAGVATVAPDDSSDGIAIPALAIGKMPGTRAEVDSDTQLGLTATYMLNSAWGVELLAATPFKHDITANLGGGVKVKAGDTKHLPPTLSLVWYPLGSASAIKPYIGAGLNYTTFFSEGVNGELEALAGDLADVGGPLPMRLKLDDSWGFAAQIGVDVALTDRWHLNGSLRWIDIDTKATFSASGVGKVITVGNVEIDPWVYQVNLGYRF